VAEASAALSATPSASVDPGSILTPIPVVPPIPVPAATASPTSTPRPKPGKVVKKLDVPISKRLPCYEFPRQGCVNLVDIYHPTNKGGWPTVVTIHGRPRTPTDMAELAKSLAAKGAVVFNADYRGVRPVSKGFPESIHDVACAVRYARANTAKYGGDPDHIVLVGHSYGGYVGMMVSVAGDRMPGKGIGCLEDRGSSLPDGFVHVAGVSITKASEPLDVIFFGGPQSAIPEVWRRGNVFHQIDVGGNRDLKVGIIFELNDPFLGYGHATWLRDELRENGYDVRMRLLEEGSTHFDVLDMDTALGRRILDFTRRIITRTAPTGPASAG
jgi:pimeloyl-ACP methyl ester carboxylesterase